MKVGTSMKEKTIYALGVFDGVHLGHQALLRTCRDVANNCGCKAGAVTFGTHPDTLVLGKTPKLINTMEDRKWLLEKAGMAHVAVLPFDEALRNMPWEAFLSMLRREYGAAGFVCGEDFRFGHKGGGTAKLLQAYCKEENLPCAVVPEQKIEGIIVSSTHIRQLLEAGELELANRFLGHAHVLTGRVVSGRRLGRTLGIPTANLLIPEGVAQLRHGVYACKALTEGKEYVAVTNVGSRPTVGGHRVTVEPWLLDFDGDLYGKTLTLEFYAFLRPEKKFDSLEDLKTEILENAAQTRKIFEKT